MGLPTLSSKGIAIHAVALVVIFGFFVLVLFMVFSGYIEIQNCDVARMACANRQQTYCFTWWKNDRTFASGQPEWQALNTCNEAGEFVACDTPTAEQCAELIS